MQEAVLTNAQLVLADAVVAGTLVVRDGIIAEVDTARVGQSRVPGAIDLEGDYVLPGLVELHTDNVERHMMPRPGSVWPTHSAIVNHDRELASCGITTVFDALTIGDFAARDIRVELAEQFCPMLEALGEIGALKVDHYVHLRCEVSAGDLLSILDGLFDQKIVGMISVMDHTPGQRQFRKMEKYEEYYRRKFSMTDEELRVFCAQQIENQKAYSASNRAAVVEMSHARELPLASHDDATPEHVEEAIADRMVIAEFPTTMEAAEASHGAGMAVLMGGPNLVRGKSHSGNIAAIELAEAGLLDIISSDYVPSSLLYGAVMLADADNGIDLARAVAMVTKTPAESVRLDDRGELAVGKRADLVRMARIDDGRLPASPIIREVWRRGEKIA